MTPDRNLIQAHGAYVGIDNGISIPLIILNCGWIANSEMKTGVTEVTISSLFAGVLFILFW